MQRDYWWTQRPGRRGSGARPQRRASGPGERTVLPAGGAPLSTRQVPVLFARARRRPDARPHQRHQRFQPLPAGELPARPPGSARSFPEFVRIHEEPLLPRGLGSAAFDGDGVATAPKDLVSEGVLRTYLFDAYSACRLGMPTTGNAGGCATSASRWASSTAPACWAHSAPGSSLPSSWATGSNPVTGDYSRGAAGFWVENGEIQYPVEEITIAGNLKRDVRGAGRGRQRLRLPRQHPHRLLADRADDHRRGVRLRIVRTQAAAWVVRGGGNQVRETSSWSSPMAIWRSSM
jgi:PmbA protein